MTKSTKIIAALGVAAGLGIAALPAGAIFADELIPFNYATATDTDKDVTVKLTVSESIAIATEDTECDAGSMSVSSTDSCTQKIAGGTNNVNGFTLSVQDKDAETDLTTGTGSTVAEKIAAVDGTLTAGMNGGGWNLTGGALTQKAITASAQDVIVTNAPKEVQISMTYNFATSKTQQVGDYEDVITYTIAKNESSVATEAGISANGTIIVDANGTTVVGS